ncbi:MAG: nitrogenase component 1 [Eubacteriaceae bacterium]|nr:nitrogenase component 1 [Eubacteriaceae bacterium]
MENYLYTTYPDSFSGALFAFEGIEKSINIANSPTGCKYFHSAVSDAQSYRQYEFDPLNFPQDWYFGQPRVPSTYLDSKDYVFGSIDKLAELVKFVKAHTDFAFLSVTNSPGAALIGDDIKALLADMLPDTPFASIESPGFSSEIAKGFSTASLAVLDSLHYTSAKPEEKTVNIIGLCIYHKNFKGDKIELARLFSLCGIKINCFLLANSTVEELSNVNKAALNIVLHPEYGLDVAVYLEERFGTQYIIPDGLPLGFGATEAFIKQVCEALGADPSLALQDCEKARATAFFNVSRVNSLTGLPKGVAYAIEGTYSEIYSYVRFLSGYLGMEFESASVVCPASAQWEEQALKLLGGRHMLEDGLTDSGAQIVLGNANTIAGLKMEKKQFCGIEISLPSMGYIDILPKTHLGVTGTLALLEAVLNALPY